MKAKALLPILLIVLVLLVVVLDTQRRSAQKELKNLTVRLEQLQGNNQANQEKATQVVEKVKKLMDIDTSVEPTVATIVDVEKLKAQNPFYNKAQNGDYLIVTPTRAVLYREEDNIILDVVPVQIEQPTGENAGDVTGGAAASTATSAAMQPQQ
jgi:hypothetical protein